MADKNSLIQTLPPEARDDAEKVYAEIGRTMPDPDLRDFVAELHRRGLLDEGQLRSAVMELEATRRIDRVEEDVHPATTSHLILGPLGAGAMGEVLLAKDRLGRVVAVKRMLPGMEKRKALARRFFKEAQVTAQLDHPAIIPIHGLIDTPEGSLGYAMKLVRGQTFEDYLEEASEQAVKGRVDEEHALPARLERFLQVCDAISYAHDRGVVHRDLKPENIMVGAFRQVIVMDWGIAKLIARPDGEETLDAEGMPASHKTQQTRIGMVMGTPRYMSPEQAEGRNDILDGRSDQYALGLILQEIVTLQPAVKGDLDLEQCLQWARTAKRQPYSVLHRKQALPKQLLAIIDKACQLDPAKRYRSVGAMAEDIRRHLRDEPIVARPDSLLDRLGRTVARNRGKMLVLVVLLAALGVSAVAATSAFGVAALGAAQYQAKLQEERLARILAAATDEAIHLEAAFLHWNGQLNGLGYAAEGAFSGGTLRRFDGDPYATLPELKQSPRYGQEISLVWPDVGLVAGIVDPKETEYLKQFRMLGAQMRSTLADSKEMVGSGRPGAHRNQIEAGVPIVWARVYGSNGYRVRYPGRMPTGTDSAGRPLKFDRSLPDFRKDPWFSSRQNARAVNWMTPSVDPGGMGLIATAYRPLADGETGDFIGVVAIDVSLQSVLDDLLRPPAWAHSAYLVDKEGKVVLSSDDKPDTARTFKAAEFTIPEVRTRIGKERFGSLAVESGGGSYQATWALLDATGWTYVLLVEQGKGPPEN